MPYVDLLREEVSLKRYGQIMVAILLRERKNCARPLTIGINHRSTTFFCNDKLSGHSIHPLVRITAEFGKDA
jgi:hypothetical protein